MALRGADLAGWTPTNAFEVGFASRRSESAPVEPPVFEGSPRTQQRKKDKRVQQLEQAKEATSNDAVRTALVDQILAIHKTFVEKDVPRPAGASSGSADDAGAAASR